MKPLGNQVFQMTKSTQEVDEIMIWVHCYCWFYKLLSTSQRTEFERLLRQFLDDAKFEGVGITVTEEMKVAVGGWAVFLILNRPLNITWYRHIERISIYPGSALDSEDALGLMVDGSHYCQISLAWEEVRDSSTKAAVNRNTILHEFAHSLDQIDRKVDGHPTVLLTGDELKEWRKVFSRSFIHSKSKPERERLWRFFDLGAWNEFDPDDASCIDVGELFAVSTEFFFECPSDLQEECPEIYTCLMLLYRFNPIEDFPKKTKMQKAWDTIKMISNRRE